jgi:hypothetical protein
VGCLMPDRCARVVAACNDRSMGAE